MFPRPRLTSEQRAFAQGVAATAGQMRVMLVDAATTYVALNPLDRPFDDEAHEHAWDWVERIAVQWRDAEEAGATHPTVEQDLSSERPHQLLGAIEDSLILAAIGDPDHRALILSIDETTHRIGELDVDGAWETVDIRPRDATLNGEHDELLRRFDELETRVLEAVGEAALAFPKMAPDDSKLSEAQVADCREHLIALAACGQELDHERALVAALIERRDLRPSTGMLRSMVQALVLRLSDDPERRAHATPLRDLAERYQLVLQDWKTWYAEVPEQQL